MTTTFSEPVIAGLFPEPKLVTILEGQSDLCTDVRLVTSNVLPLQRKAMRGILTGAGIRVVANKKKYVIEAKVETEDAFDFPDIPAEAKEEYYELEIQGSMVFIRTPSQLGALWGTQTLGTIYRALSQGITIPNLLIRDWPSMPNRGIFVENKWGPDRMLLPDWCEVIDRLSALKMNRLGIGLYGCWGSCRFEGRPTEFLMVPVPGHEELRSEHSLSWYSPRDDAWKAETYLPRMFEEDFLGEVVTYGREKGVTVIPFVNSFGHNTLIPRTLPALSAKGADGSPAHVGYCIRSTETRAFIEAFYGSIIERYYPEGIDYFHIQMDEVWPDYPAPEDPRKIGSPWCEGPECSQTTKEENLRDYILWLVKMLTGKGVGKVVMWNDQLTRHMDVLNDEFIAELDRCGLRDRLIIHWWWYSNEALNEQTHPKIGMDLGLDGWVAPMTCYFNWSRHDFRRKNIELMLQMAENEKASGAVSYAVHDPSHTDHEALLAGYCWSSTALGTMEEVEAAWALIFGADRQQDYLKAVELLLQANSRPGLVHTYQYTYTYTNKDVTEWPRPYPGEALARLEAIEGVDVAKALTEAGDIAAKAKEIFLDLAKIPGLDATAKACVESLAADAARIEALSGTFTFLLDVRKAAASGSITSVSGEACKTVRDALVHRMCEIEAGKPRWVAPATLQALSLLLAFLDQLSEDLAAGDPGAVRWTASLPEPSAAPMVE